MVVYPPRTPTSFAQSGLGTYTSRQLLTTLGHATAKFIDLAVAWDLDNHVMSMFALHSVLISHADASLTPTFR